MSNYKTEAEILTGINLSLTNATNDDQIKAALEEYGYDQAMMEEGEALYTKAKEAYDLNKQEDDETVAASIDFKNKRIALGNVYKKDRKKAAVAFKRDEATMIKLGLATSPPRTYAEWLETLTKFYSDLKEETLSAKIARFKIDEAYLTAKEVEIQAAVDARSLYIKEDGQSQQATKNKNKAIEELEQWMDDFKDTAVIALEEQPQLLETMGYIIKS